MEYLSFKIDGEFVCRLARQWFWDENRPYDKCEELLLSCLGTDEITLEEKKEIVVNILEGRQILKGINELELVEDGKNIRPISQKIGEYEKKEAIKKIKNDMRRNPEYYFDKYASEKDLDEYEEYLEQMLEDKTEVTFFNWLNSSRNYWSGKFSNESNYRNKDKLLNGGYLLNPYLVYEIFGNKLSDMDEDKKYEILYRYWKKENEKDKSVVNRQKLYEAYLKKEDESKVIKQNNYEDENELYFLTEPDDFISEYGLIDRKGNYYSCGYGGHSAKVYNMMKKYPERFNITKEDAENLLPTSKETDIVFEMGWIITHNPYLGGDPYFYISDVKTATKAQVDAAFDYMAHFNRRKMDGLEKLLKDNY